MGAVFLTLLHMSLAASALVVVVVVLRLLLKRAPKAIHCALWAMVALRLLLPFSVESSFSLIPQDVAERELLTEWQDDYVGDVTVIYDDWANYTYCEFAGTGYPYVRVQAGVSVDAYSNVRYGHPTDANGNTVVDDNHVHNDGEAHHKLIAFDYLFGGPANHRYCYYGINEHPGVTVIYNNK